MRIACHLLRSIAVVSVLGASVAAAPLRAQRVPIDSVRLNDSTIVYAIVLIDGSKIIGRVTSLTADSVRIQSTASTTGVARTAIREVRAYPLSTMHKGELWPENPHATRLLFSPTAIPLRKGESYFSDFWIFLVSAATGVTDRFTIGGGMTLVPSTDFSKNIFYLIPKYTVVNRPTTKVAIGALMAHLPFDAGTSSSVGVLYGVGTLGSRENNVTLGAGWGYVGGTLSKTPVMTLGGQRRVGRRLALISENWFVPSRLSDGGVITYGVRILGESIAVDLALANAPKDLIFPGVPLLGFAVRF